MSALLARTKYASTDLNYYLCGLPGAARSKTKSGAQKRMYFAGSQRSVVVLPPPILAALGMDKEPEYGDGGLSMFNWFKGKPEPKFAVGEMVSVVDSDFSTNEAEVVEVAWRETGVSRYRIFRKTEKRRD